jgi:hypothetical protein
LKDHKGCESKSPEISMGKKEQIKRKEPTLRFIRDD